MSEASKHTGAWLDGLLQACERLVHPSIEAADLRQRQCRLMCLLLVAPLFVSAALAQPLLSSAAPAIAFSAICGTFALFWALAAGLAVTARHDLVEPATLAAGAVAITAMIAVSGGIASPMALLVLALAIEPYGITRERKAVIAGFAATAAVLFASAVGMPSFEGSAQDARQGAWQWVLPAAYLATLWLRRDRLAGHGANDEAEPESTALEDIIDAVLIDVSRNGDVTAASRQACDLVRVEPEFLLGQGLFERIHVSDRVKWLSALADARDGAPCGEFHIRLRIPAEETGAARICHALFGVEIHARGDAGSCLAILRRADAFAAMRGNLEEMTENKIAAEANSARLLADLSHELRTPLNSVVGFADTLLHGVHGSLANAGQREYLGHIRESGLHMLSLVTAILDMSRLDAGGRAIERTAFALEQAVETSVAMVACQAREKEIEIRTQIDPTLREVNADRRVLQQVLVNLLSNAVKFTPSGGEVAIGAGRRGDMLELTVEDTGIGIAASDLERIGRPFVRIINDFTRGCDGAGLGLALVKGLVELHNGALSIESAPGKGTIVKVSVPLSPAQGGERRGAGQIIEITPKEQREQPDAQLRKTA